MTHDEASAGLLLAHQPKVAGRILLGDLFIYSLFFAILFREYIFLDLYVQPTGYLTELIPESWPHNRYLVKHLSEGILPFWNYSTWLGIPFIAVPQVGFWYPANWLYAFAQFPDALRLDLLTHAYLLGVFTYVLVRYLSPSRAAALWSALSMLASSATLAWNASGNPAILHTTMFGPLALLGLIQVVNEPRRGWMIFLAVVLALQIFGGYLQAFMYEMFLLALLTLFFLVAGLVTRKLTLRGAFIRGAAAMGAVLAGLSIGAIQLVPSLELLLSESQRNGGLSPAYLTPFPGDMIPSQHLGIPFKNWRMLTDSSMSPWPLPDTGLGIFTVAFAALAIFRRSSLVIVGILGVHVFAVLIAAQYPAALYDLFTKIPVVGSARIAMRILDSLRLLPYIVAGFGVALLGTRQSTSVRNWQVLIVSTLALVLLWIRAHLYGSKYPNIELFVALALAGLWIGWHRDRWKTSGVLWIAACLLVETTTFSPTFKGGITPLWAYKPNPQYMVWTKARTDRDRVLLKSSMVTLPPVLPAQIGLVTGDRMVYGKGPLALERFGKVFNRASGGTAIVRDEQNRLIRSDMEALMEVHWLDERSGFLLDLLNVRWMVVPGKNEFRPGSIERVGDKMIRRTYEDLTVYENRGAFPIAYTCHAVEVCASDDALVERMFTPNFDHRATALTTSKSDFSDLSPALKDEPVTVTQYTPNRVEMNVEMTSPGILVLTDMYYPGWTAVIDGKERREVFPVHEMLRGVKLGPGVHQVRFEYWPTYFTAAILLSGGTLLLCAGTAVWLGWRRISKKRGHNSTASTVQEDD